jgi:tetratricopeptide (TPR) repeat protein
MTSVYCNFLLTLFKSLPVCYHKHNKSNQIAGEWIQIIVMVPESDNKNVASGTNSPVSASQISQTKKHSFKKATRLIILALIVIALAAAGYFGYKKFDLNRSQKKGPEGVTLKKLEGDELNKEIQKLTFEKKFEAARQLINFQDGAKDNFAYQLQLVTTYMNQGASKEALATLLDMEKRFPDKYQVTRLIAVEYEVQNDKTKAIEYYRKTVDLLKKEPENPQSADDIMIIEQTIKKLEKK